MSTMEIILIVCACSIPVLTILFAIPRKKKGTNEAKPAVEEVKPAEVTETSAEVETDDLQADIKDFETYIKEQRQATESPERLEEPTDVKTLPYKEELSTETIVQPEELDVDRTKEELNHLSPELKAMIMAGVLNKKDYDEE